MNQFYAALCLVCVLVFGGCAEPAATDKETIYVSILPLRGLMHEITANDFDIEVLVPPGANPETFELSARQLSALHKAPVVFNVGLIPFEQTLLAELGEKTVNLCHGIELLQGACSHNTDHRHAHGTDPHIWTAPRALKQMARNAYEVIHALHPDSVKYTQNHALLQQKLDALDRYTEGRIAATDTQYFIIYHPALTYYAHDYGIEQRAIEADGKEPSARHIAIIIDRARKDGVKRIFCQSQFPRSAVEIIAEDIAAEVVMVDPLAEDVLGNIRELTDLITAQ